MHLLLTAVDDDQVSTQILTALSAAVPVLCIIGENIEPAIVLTHLSGKPERLFWVNWGLF